jgi:hypothetical protein
MQSENFDKKIKDSLSQRPPGNDNPAWDKMEPLLDKHMPVDKKDRRRIFFILFLFLLLGGGGLLIWKNSTGDKNNITAIESQNNNADPKAIGSTKDNNSAANVRSDIATSANKENLPERTSGNAENKTGSHVITIVPQNSLPQIIAGKEITLNLNQVRKEKEKKINTPATENTDPAKKISNNVQGNEKQSTIEDVSKKEPNPVSLDKNETVAPETQKPVTENKTEGQKPEAKGSQPLTTKGSGTQKQKSQRSFFDNLFFSASAGPDFSSIGFHSPGKIELAYGAGLGYRISNKFSIRTGLYSARKVYTADPEDYDPPYNVAQYYPNLKYVDANCKVYEIPVMIDYTISNNKKGGWFVSGGVSSLIMKEEKYNYYFKPTYSPTYVTYTRTIKDQNKHYFSQLNISGGYTRNINNNISLRAEPYMKFAMQGIGFGKVNLNSSGVLFSAIIKPFAKK